jgi:hypothetical protein
MRTIAKIVLVQDIFDTFADISVFTIGMITVME